MLQSIQLPFAILPVLHFTSDKQIMGKFANKGIVKGICWFLATLVIIINVYLVTTFVTAADSPTPQTPLFFSFIIFVGLSYFGFIFFVIREDIQEFLAFLKGARADTSVSSSNMDNVYYEDLDASGSDSTNHKVDYGTNYASGV